tara:strand:+ start:1367 stop:1960 length:594 start_codon:yes stop_codon:yes gene_type:complete
MLIQNLPDEKLVKHYLSGNTHALERLINKHRDRIYFYIISKVKIQSLADDIFQDTFFKVIKCLKKGKYNEQGKFLPWVMRIAHNLVIDHFRKSKRISIIQNIKKDSDFDILNLISDESKNFEKNILKKEQFKELNYIIDKLPEDQKEVLIMRYYEDLSFKEIADKTNVSINTSLGRMRYALINLRKLMSEFKIDLKI